MQAATAIAFAAGQIAWLLGIAAVSGSVGVATWRLAIGRVSVDAGVALALGLAAIAQVALLCALVGVLPVVLPASILVAAVGLWLVVTRRSAVTWPMRATWPRTAVIIGAATWLASYPPIGFDQTMYHLPFAELFARNGGVPVAPELRYPVFAPLTELLQALVLPLGGALATQKVGVVALLGTCLITWTLAARIVGDHGAAAVAVATAGASPLVLHAASAGYVEPVLACWSAAALLLTLESARTRSTAMAATAGALVGSLVAAKYTGLVLLAVAWVPLVTAGAGQEALRDWRPPRRLLGAWALAAVVMLAPSTMRLVWHTGNPVFPFAPSLFGQTIWHNMEIEQPRATPAGMATLLADTVLRRAKLGGLPHGAPLLVVTLPLALVAVWSRPREAGPLLAALAIWLIVVPPWAHYHVAILPHAALLTAMGLAALLTSRSWRSGALVSVAVASALVAPAYAAHRWVTAGPPPATMAGRDEWSMQRMPVLRAVRFINDRDAAATVFGVGAERYVWFVRGRLLGDYNGPWRYDDQLALARTRGVSDVLDRSGARFLLLRSPAESWSALADRDEGLRRIYEDASATVYERAR